MLRVPDAATNSKAVAKIAASIPTFTTKVSEIDPRAKLVCTVSFGSQFWDAISPQKRPAGLHPFKAIKSGPLSAPSTGGDVLLHILSKRHDLNFELATRIRTQLGDMVEVMDEVHGFQYLDSRDLTGFIDGTENPQGNKDRTAVAIIGKEDATFAGGSYLHSTLRPQFEEMGYDSTARTRRRGGSEKERQ